MDFDLTDEQEQLRNTLSAFLKDHYSFEQHRASKSSKSGWRPEIWKSFADDLGLLGAPLPERVGGLGGSPVDIMVIMKEFGSALVAEPFLETVVICGDLLAQATGQRANAELERIVCGDSVLALAWAEATTRYRLGDVSTMATRTGDGWRLTGNKTHVMGAPWAQRLLVSARTSDAPYGVSLLLVEKNAPGVTSSNYITIDGRRASNVMFENVELPADALMGIEGAAIPLLESARDRAIAAQCAEALGIMHRMLNDTVDYTKQRRQFSQPIASFQALQHRMVDMQLELEKATSATFLVTLSLELEPDARALAASSAKYTVTNAGRYIGQNAVQLHGGMGMTDDLALTHYFRRLIVIDSEFGDSAYHLGRYAAITAKVHAGASTGSVPADMGSAA